MNTVTALPKPAVQLLEARLLRPMQQWNVWCVDLPVGHTMDDLLRPDYWGHVHRKLRRGDRIEVLAEDDSIDCELRVVEVQAHAVYVRVIRPNAVTPAALAVAAAPAIDPENTLPRVDKWAGPTHKFRVLGLDGQVVSHGHATKELATEEMHRLFPQRRRA